MTGESHALLLNSQYRPVETPSYSGEENAASRADLLTRAIFERCVEHELLIVQHKCSRGVALACSIVASLAANASYIPISLQMPVGPLFAATNFLGFFQLDVWAIRGTIGDILSLKSSQEIVLHQRAARHKCYTVAIVASALVIALLSQVPVALPALDYNGVLGVPSLIALFVGGSLIPIRSLQLGINKFLRTKSCGAGEVEKKLEKLREVMTSLVDEHRDLFKKMDQQEKIEHIDQVKPKAEGSELARTHAYVTAVFDKALNNTEKSTSSVVGRAFQVLGGGLTLSMLSGLAYYTFCKMNENVFNNDILAGATAGAVVLAYSYLAGQSIINTAKGVGESLVSMVTGKREKSLAEQFRPKLNVSLKLLGLLVDVGALGATVVIWGDFLQGHPAAQIYFEVTMCLAYFLFLSTATMNMADEVVEEVVRYKGTESEKQIMAFHDDLQKLQKLIESSSSRDFAAFVANVSEELRAKLLGKVDLVDESLEAYAGEHSLA